MTDRKYSQMTDMSLFVGPVYGAGEYCEIALEMTNHEGKQCTIRQGYTTKQIDTLIESLQIMRSQMS